MLMNATTVPFAFEYLESAAPSSGGGGETRHRLSGARQTVMHDIRLSTADGVSKSVPQPTRFRMMCSSVVSWHHGGINE
jgi:hypothetical protein